jgi:hypothetical protein
MFFLIDNDGENVQYQSFRQSYEVILSQWGGVGLPPAWVLIAQPYIQQGVQNRVKLKVHKNENFFGFDFEFCTISL